MQQPHRLLKTVAAVLLVSLAGISPAAAAPTSVTPVRTKPLFTTVLSWGKGTKQVGLVAEAEQSPARGPSSLALLPDGSTLILDRVNERVVRLSARGDTSKPWTYARAPRDAELIATGSQTSRWLLFSPLRSVGWTFRGTRRLAEWSLPRSLPGFRSFSFEKEGLVGHSDHQERYFLGSIGASSSLARVLRSKKEGTFRTPQGLGVAVRVFGRGRVQLLVLPDTPHPMASARRIDLPFEALSARLLGMAGSRACMLIEQGPKDVTTVDVYASVVCTNVESGQSTAPLRLPEQQLYVPRDFVAFGGKPARLVHMQTTRDSLVVRSWLLGANDWRHR